MQRKVEPNDGETWVLMTMFMPLDPALPEAGIAPWTLQLCEPRNNLFCFKLKNSKDNNSIIKMLT